MILGIGTDITHVDRFEKNIEGIAKKILTEGEQEEYMKISDEQKKQWIAGRFAIKEAVYKAMNGKIKAIIQVEVVKDKNGAPKVYMDGLNIFVSLSHDKGTVAAMAIVEK